MQEHVNVIDLTLGETKTRLIGDPHQGRVYRSGVPLHRRGEREQLNRDTFLSAMLELPEDVEMVVIVGDLFDKFVVDPATLLFVYEILAEAADVYPHIQFIVLRGNHDASRDTALRSSFDILFHLLDWSGVIELVREEPHTTKIGEDRFLFLPWHPFQTAREMAKKAPDGKYTAAFGHWDIESFGGDDHNLIPTEELSEITELAITGHVHQRQEFERNGIKVLVTGSLLPQAHGEDLTGEMFVTVDLEDLDPDEVKDKCVRVVLKPGEELPADLDCLHLTVKRVNEQKEEVDLDQVEMAGFHLETLWREAAAENSVSLAQTNRFWGLLSKSMEAQE